MKGGINILNLQFILGIEGKRNVQVYGDYTFHLSKEQFHGDAYYLGFPIKVNPQNIKIDFITSRMIQWRFWNNFIANLITHQSLYKYTHHFVMVMLWHGEKLSKMFLTDFEWAIKQLLFSWMGKISGTFGTSISPMIIRSLVKTTCKNIAFV